MKLQYEVLEKRKPGSDLVDYEIRVAGATRGSPKAVTVWGHYGTDARSRAEIVVRAMNDWAMIREARDRITQDLLIGSDWWSGYKQALTDVLMGRLEDPHENAMHRAEDGRS